MSTTPSVDFESRWYQARRANDTQTLVDLALDHYDSDTVPKWLRDDVLDVCDVIAQDLTANINRQDDSEAGVHLVQLSSLLGDTSCMFALLGLAYQCNQPCEQDVPINPKIPELLDSQLRLFDVLSTESWPNFARGWRELAIRRVECLVRLDLARQVNPVRERYIEAVNMANLIHVYEPAAGHLNFIRAKLPLLNEAHTTLSKYVGLLEHQGERAILIEDLEMLEGLINNGKYVLNIPRR